MTLVRVYLKCGGVMAVEARAKSGELDMEILWMLSSYTH